MAETGILQNPFHSRWARMRDEAYVLALLTQRHDALWAWPTSEIELGLNFAPADDPESKIRSRGFGHSSITTSFVAMRAIAEAANSLPTTSFANCLKAISTHRDISGGYGSPHNQFHTVDINAVPRHTALGLIANLFFSPLSRSYASPEALNESVRWLLQATLKSGGWAYKPDKRSGKLEFLTTASVISALCLYLDRCDDTVFAKQISAAIASGFKALAKSQRQGVWDGSLDNPKAKNTEVRDSAFAIQLMCLGNRSGILDRCVDQEGALKQLTANIANKRASDGWPSAIGMSDADPAATMAVLQALADTGFQSELDDVQFAHYQSVLLVSFEKGSLKSATAAFDWYGFLRFAAVQAGKMDIGQQARLEAKCQSAIAKFKTGSLYQADVGWIEDSTKGAIEYALSGGGTLKAGPKTLIQEWSDRWRFEASKYVIFGLVGYSIGNWNGVKALLVAVMQAIRENF